MAALTTSFQARAATKPKPEVARASIWVMMAEGSSLAELGVLILAILLLFYPIFVVDIVLG